ncbi:MAG: flippase, partial [Flavobacteriaceae bacterium]|nr:flippase [Flavobacteriaceae bacterium]
FSSVLLGVFLNYILIETNGLVGAAQAILLLMSIRALTMWIYSNRLYPLG